LLAEVKNTSCAAVWNNSSTGIMGIGINAMGSFGSSKALVAIAVPDKSMVQGNGSGIWA
jgi:hypothetical protein